MKASLWAIVGIAAAGAGGSGYVLMPATSATSAAPAARDVAAVPQPANGQSAFATDLSRAPITAPLYGDPFGNWTPKPKPAPTAEAPAPARPVIPVFPYSYAGTLRKGREAPEAFLLRGGKELVPVKAGAVLDGAWRVEVLTGDRIEVTYLPLGERVSMLLAALTGGSNAAVASTAAASSVANAYGDQAMGLSSVEPATAPRRSDPIAASNSGPSGGRAVQPMAAAPGSAAPTAASGSSASVLGSPPPTTTARLGTDVPAQGSMPLGTAASGTFPKGDTPTGKLGH
jgi:hypothetical protein